MALGLLCMHSLKGSWGQETFPSWHFAGTKASHLCISVILCRADHLGTILGCYSYTHITPLGPSPQSKLQSVTTTQNSAIVTFPDKSAGSYNVLAVSRPGYL